MKSMGSFGDYSYDYKEELKKNQERASETVELKNGGAQYVFDKNTKKRLEITKSQLDEYEKDNKERLIVKEIKVIGQIHELDDAGHSSTNGDMYEGKVIQVAADTNKGFYPSLLIFFANYDNASIGSSRWFLTDIQSKEKGSNYGVSFGLYRPEEREYQVLKDALEKQFIDKEGKDLLI